MGYNPNVGFYYEVSCRRGSSPLTTETLDGKALDGPGLDRMVNEALMMGALPSSIVIKVVISRLTGWEHPQ